MQLEYSTCADPECFCFCWGEGGDNSNKLKFSKGGGRGQNTHLSDRPLGLFILMLMLKTHCLKILLA